MLPDRDVLRPAVFSRIRDQPSLLSAPARVMIERLAARTGNPYGKAPGDLDRILADLDTVEPMLRRTADHEIHTTIPLTNVVAKVVHLAGLSPQAIAP